MLSGGLGQGADNIAGPHDQLAAILFEQSARSSFSQQRQRQAAFAALIVPAHRHVVERGDPAAGRRQIDVVLVFADLRGTSEKLSAGSLSSTGI